MRLLWSAFDDKARELSLLRDSRGSELVEKSILIALGALALLVGVSRLSGGIKQAFDNSGRNLAQNLSVPAQPLQILSALPKMGSSDDAVEAEPGPGKPTLFEQLQALDERMKAIDEWLNEHISPSHLIDRLAERIDHGVELLIDRHSPRLVASVVKGVFVDLVGGTVHLAASTLTGGGLIDLEVGLLTDPISTIGGFTGQFAASIKRDPVRVLTSLLVPIPLAKLGLAARASKLALVTRRASIVERMSVRSLREGARLESGRFGRYFERLNFQRKTLEVSVDRAQTYASQLGFKAGRPTRFFRSSDMPDYWTPFARQTVNELHISGWDVLEMHGKAGKFTDEGGSFSASQIAKRFFEPAEKNPAPILLFTCEAGRVTADIAAIAQSLADITGRPVVAGTRLVNVDGRVFALHKVPEAEGKWPPGKGAWEKDGREDGVRRIEGHWKPFIPGMGRRAKPPWVSKPTEGIRASSPLPRQPPL